MSHTATLAVRDNERVDVHLHELLDVQPRTAPAQPPAPGVRLNLGSGIDRKEGWVNVDADPGLSPDVCEDAVAYVERQQSGSADEIYLGHFLEHLEHDAGARLLAECFRVLKVGGRIGVVVPDTRAIMERYVAEDLDLDDLCRLWLYSTVQETWHKWSYDLPTLRRAVARAGFDVTGEIDRFADPRLQAGAWWQCGVDCVKRPKRLLDRVLRR